MSDYLGVVVERVGQFAFVGPEDASVGVVVSAAYCANGVECSALMGRGGVELCRYGCVGIAAETADEPTVAYAGVGEETVAVLMGVLEEVSVLAEYEGGGFADFFVET